MLPSVSTTQLAAKGPPGLGAGMPYNGGEGKYARPLEAGGSVLKINLRAGMKILCMLPLCRYEFQKKTFG